MERYYQNPIAQNGDFADPFVLRYNGIYYLYCTNPDLRCWSSADLLHWHPEGPVIAPDTFPGLVPFAPEVVYSNGSFYMYTSPSGLGHYVLKSESPTGPFVKITGNVAHAIDGSVLIDDDGKWYFYWAGDEGIWGCEMPSPTEFGEPVLTGAFLHGWTEGPFVCKRDGTYYMTYTGNHYLSRGYRINTAWSRHPLKGYRDDPYQPFVHTQDGAVGLGHSSTVLGPDLVSHYLIYHNLNPDVSRDLNIDRQLWHREVTQFLGPTGAPQLAPTLPDYTFPKLAETKELQWKMEQGKWSGDSVHTSGPDGFRAVTEQSFRPAAFTAELHLALPDAEPGELQGVLLEEGDDGLCYLFSFSGERRCVQVWLGDHNDPFRLIAESPLPQDCALSTLHSVRIQAAQGKLVLWVDNRLQMEQSVAFSHPVHLGYASCRGRIACGYTAVTETVWEDSARKAAIPVNCSFAPVFGAGEATALDDGGILLNAGKAMAYTLLVQETTKYHLAITIQDPPHGTAAFRVLLDGALVAAPDCRQSLADCVCKLAAGQHTLLLEGTAEVSAIRRLELFRSSKPKEAEASFPTCAAGPYGKRLFGKESWSDYLIFATVSVALRGPQSRAGILLRVTEPSEGGEGADPVLGVNFLCGYSVSFTAGQLEICRHRYDRTVLTACPFALKTGAQVSLRIAVRGDEISVFAGNAREPLLTARDEYPLTHGCAGIWTFDGNISAEKIKIVQTRETNKT